MKKIITGLLIIFTFVFSVVAEDMVEILSDIADKIVIFDDSDNSIKKEKPKFAFVTLNSDLDNQEIEQHITDALMEAAFSTGKIRIIEREKLENILMELNFQSSGIIDESTAKEIGNIAGVDYICYGKLMEVEGEDYYHIQVKVTDVQSGELVSMVSQFVDPDDYLIELTGKEEKVKKEEESQQKKKEQQQKKNEKQQKNKKRDHSCINMGFIIEPNADSLSSGLSADLKVQRSNWIIGGSFEWLSDPNKTKTNVTNYFFDLGYAINSFDFTAGIGYSLNPVNNEFSSFVPRLQLNYNIRGVLRIGYSLRYPIAQEQLQHVFSVSYMAIAW